MVNTPWTTEGAPISANATPFREESAAALYDEDSRQLILARDRFSIKPLYYSLGADGLRFTSEIEALLIDPTLDRSHNPTSINTYFALRYVPTPFSIFKTISKLSPGTFLTS